VRHVEKGREPRALAAFRSANPSADWHRDVGSDVSGPVRLALIRAQLGLCCYCGARIAPDRCHVEHVRPHTAFEALPLAWANLFASCNSDQSCGRHKGAKLLARLDPGEHPERFLRLDHARRLEGLDDESRNDLETLGLNGPLLRQSRDQAVSAFIRAVAGRHPGHWTRAVLERELARAVELGLPYLPAIELFARQEVQRR
jgi:hypothetical protein